MRLAFLAFALALPAASAAEAPAASPQRFATAGPAPARLCNDPLKVRPVRSPDAARPKRLGELPPADMTLAVLNRVGDCIEPVTVRQGIGALGRR